MVRQRQISATDKLLIGEGVSARDFDGEWIVLDLKVGSYYGLDQIGGEVWRQLSSGLSLEETARVLAANYAVSPETVLQDLVGFAHELVESGLAQVKE